MVLSFSPAFHVSRRSSGREIDEKGNLVKKIEPVSSHSLPPLLAPSPTSQVKTLAANVAVGQAQKKKENPYLSHHRGGSATKSSAEVPIDPSVPAAPSSATPLQVHDERIKTSSRDLRARKAFNFIEAGLHLFPFPPSLTSISTQELL